MRTFIPLLLLLATGSALWAQALAHQVKNIPASHHEAIPPDVGWELPRSVEKFIRKNANLAEISAGQAILEQEKQEVEKFYIFTTEVSNAAYREFLSALEKQGKREELNRAQIQPEGWKNLDDHYNEPTEQVYHIHPAYDEYPVVNISYQAAQSYCEWLTREYQKMGLPEGYHFRLPTKAEWIRASRGDKMAPYPWGGYALQNKKGCVLANFNVIGPENITFNSETGRYEVAGQPATNQMHHPTGQGPTPVESYVTNDFGLYNTVGNVAEMLKQEGIAIGGNWRSPGYDVRVESLMAYQGPRADVGFRPVLVRE